MRESERANEQDVPSACLFHSGSGPSFAAACAGYIYTIILNASREARTDDKKDERKERRKAVHNCTIWRE